jgi:hypothetical protein
MTITRVVAASGLAAFGLAAALLSAATPASAAKPGPEAETHCIIEVIDVVDGVFVTTPEVCFDSLDAARSLTFSPEASTLGTNVVGTHFTAQNYLGSTMTIVGTTCNGGIWQPTGSWNNNIESSYNYCGTDGTKFFDNSSCTLTAITILVDTATLGTMNNKTSCVKYL